MLAKHKGIEGKEKRIEMYKVYVPIPTKNVITMYYNHVLINIKNKSKRNKKLTDSNRNQNTAAANRAQ